MPAMIDAVYENGVLRPLAMTDLKEHRRYRLVREEADVSGETDLTAHGISQEQAEELRAGMQTFAEDWESAEMSVYDDYDTAKSRL
ncbi:MAG: antitoxin family protein [Blastocatellia bacterium]